MTRYEYGGDDFVWAELGEELSFRTHVTVRAVVARLEDEQVPGVLDICPNSVSYLVHFDPDRLHPDELIEKLKVVEAGLGDPARLRFPARLVDVPIYYDDPWSTACLRGYGDRRQDPDVTDLEYMARTNGFGSVEELVSAHSAAPYLVMGVGFTPGCYWSAAMVPRERTIVAPTYIRPRTTTPERAFSQGGAIAAIYPSPGPGGYQLIGIAAAPLLDLSQRLADFADSPVFTRAGDIFKHRPIDRDEYDSLRAEVEAGTFRYRIREVQFAPDRLFDDLDAYNDELMARLYAD